MSTVKIGPTGSEIIIPTVAISLPIDYQKQLIRVVMSDGSRRWGHYQGFRKWKIQCTKLIKTQLDNLITEYARNQILHFQNTFESTDWYNVKIIDFFYDSIDPISTTKLYRATMIIEET